MNRTLAALRALLALVLLVALTVGTPVALLRLGVLPHQWPTWSQITGALTGPDNGQIFLGALTLLGWCAWISFTASAVVETAAALRRRSAPRVPVLGATQRLAATLVSSIVLLLPAATALAATAAPAQAATLHLPHATTSREQAEPTSQNATAPAVGGPTVTVDEPDQTLWSLAEQYLGSGMRWKEIVTANEGVVQSDGSTLTNSTVHLVPGWKLRLPTDAHPGPDAQAAANRTSVPTQAVPASDQSVSTGRPGQSHDATGPVRDHERTHVVRPGDTLSQIAETDLGYAADYPQIATASQSTVQPDGQHLTDPNLIYPGWTLTIPQAAGTEPVTTVAGNGTGPTSPVTTPPRHNSPTAAAPTAPVPSTTAQAPTAPSTATSPTTAPTATTGAAATAGATAPTSAPTLAVPRPTEAPATAVPTTATGSGVPMRAGAGIAALLAAGLLAGYGVKRALQQRRRRPGETIAMPEETSELEHVLTHTATQSNNPHSAELLDRALRTLAAHLPVDTELPTIDGARITPAGIALRCDQDPLPPFTAASEEGWWELDPAQALLEADHEHEAPYPLLTALGTIPEGGSLLADLRAARTVLLDGSPEQVREVARSIALEAATSPWGADLQVLCCGITDPDLPAIMHTGRLQHLTQLSHAAKDLAELLLAAHQHAAAALPWVVVVADQADQADAWQLADLIARVPHAPVALVLPAAGLEGLFPAAPRLDCASTDPQASPVQDHPVVLQRVTETSYQQLLTDLRTSEQPATPAQGPWQQVPQDSTELAEEQDFADPHTAPAPVEVAAEQANGSPYLAFIQRQAAAGTTSVPSLPVASPSLDVDNPEPSLSASRDEEPETAATPVPATGKDDQRAERAHSSATEMVTPDDADGSEASVLHVPQVLVLGPLDITGLGASGRGRRLAELAAYLYLRPGRTASAIAEAMGSLDPWGETTLRSRMSQLRKLLGRDPDGTPYVPYLAGNSTYPQLAVRCDWTRFLKLSERGLTAGRNETTDLEAALALVRGRPFQGSSASWAAAEQQEMLSRIVDVAHTTATRRIGGGQWDAARAAIGKGLEVEPTAEVLYRDWITLEARRGDRAALGRVINDLNRALRTLDVDMDDETQTLITGIYTRNQRGTA